MAKKMKNVLLMALSLVLVAALAVTGTVAYLTSEDSDVNVMTLGNVKIEQHEYERQVKDGEYVTGTVDGQASYMLKPFTQAKPLYPATAVDANGNPANHGAGDYVATTVRMSQVDSYGGMQVFENKNVQDKFVTVENTGKSPAYVRTLVALEMGDSTPEEDLLGYSYHFTWGTPTSHGIVKIGNNNYEVIEFVYVGGAQAGGKHDKGVLPAGETTYPNLSQVYLKGKATNDDVEKLDGNKNGTYDILVLSQAVQTNGFANAEEAFKAAFPFGDNNENLIAWFEAMEVPVLVETAEELKAALDENKSVVLTKDINMDGYAVNIAENDNAVIDLNGHTLTSMDGGGQKGNMAIKVNRGATLTLKDSAGGGKVVSSCYGVYVQPNATFIMDGGTIDVSGNSVYDMGVIVWNGKFVMENGTINAQWGVWTTNYYKDAGEACGNCEVTIDDDCVLNSTSTIDIDIVEAPDTVLNVPANLTINSDAE